jgi:3',5'-cyclic AMP phosphodiesterase CpdA
MAVSPKYVLRIVSILEQWCITAQKQIRQFEGDEDLMPDTFTIAHLSDVHLSPVGGFMPRYWNAKRALGFANWATKRRHVHLREVSNRIIADLKRHAPDHIAVTGDLINIGLPTEYDAAMHWLATVGTPSDVSLVPGNHDIYTRLRSDPGIGRWQAYMTSDDWGRTMGGAAQSGFPYVRRAGPVAIIGLCSAVETAPGIATGRIGPEQLAAAVQMLDRLAGEGVFRLVLLHHPPLQGQTRPRHELLDAATVAEALTKSCADLVLHGHTHLPTNIALLRVGRPLHVIGVASASAGIRRGPEPLAQYNLLRIRPAGADWHVELQRRGLDGPSGGIVELERVTLG